MGMFGKKKKSAAAEDADGEPLETQADGAPAAAAAGGDDG